MNYYNEIDPFAAAWLRELIADGLIPAGDGSDDAFAFIKEPAEGKVSWDATFWELKGLRTEQ